MSNITHNLLAASHNHAHCNDPTLQARREFIATAMSDMREMQESRLSIHILNQWLKAYMNYAVTLVHAVSGIGCI